MTSRGQEGSFFSPDAQLVRYSLVFLLLFSGGVACLQGLSRYLMPLAHNSLVY